MLLLVMLSLNWCSCEVVIDNGSGIGLGCDRGGGQLRLIRISSTIKYIEDRLSGRHLSRGTGCGGSGGN